MFDVGGSELLVIGVVALIVVGPKDLPRMFHALGQFTAKARSMAREFQRAMETAAEESGVGDLGRDLKSLTSAKNLGLDAVKEAGKRLENWDEVKRASNAGLQPDPETPRGPETEALARERAEKADALKAQFGPDADIDLEAPIEVEPEPKPKARRAPSGTRAKGTNTAAAKSTTAKAATTKSTTARPKPRSTARKAAPRATAQANASTTVTAAEARDDAPKAKAPGGKAASAKAPASKPTPRKTPASKASATNTADTKATASKSAATGTAARNTTAAGKTTKARSTKQSDA